jgi:hypothetical protein
VALEENDFPIISNCSNFTVLKFLKKLATEKNLSGSSTLTYPRAQVNLLGRFTNRKEHHGWETRY